MGNGSKLIKSNTSSIAYLLFGKAYALVDELTSDSQFLAHLKKLSESTDLSESQILGFKSELLIFFLFLINLESKDYFNERLEIYQKFIEKLSSVLYEKVKEIFQNKMFIVNFKKLNINPYEAFDLELLANAKDAGFDSYLLGTGFTTGASTYFGILAPVRDRQYYEMYRDIVAQNSEEIFREKPTYLVLYNFILKALSQGEELLKLEIAKRDITGIIGSLTVLFKNMFNKELPDKPENFTFATLLFCLLLLKWISIFRYSIISFLRKVEVAE